MAETKKSPKKTPKKAAPKTAARKAGSGSEGRSLVIVESPAKARTIEKYLGADFRVLASVGHIIDLPTSKLGVDIEHDFQPQYEVIKGKKKIVEDLKRAAKNAGRVYLAPDPDREGEAIAYHIAEAIGNGKPIFRAVFNEITREAVRRGIENPTEINKNLFNAQQARRILDRLVGYKISPLLWKKVRRGLSAGRVQSVALRLICEREKEVQAFVPEEYWSIAGRAEANEPPPFTLRLDKIGGKNERIPDEAAANKILEAARNAEFKVADVTRREVAKRPFAPFITSTLQQEASRKLRYPSKRTMRIAQRLYEGIDVGEDGPTGLITYMRTDSTRLAPSALDMIRGYIHKNYDNDYLPPQARFYSKGKGAQDAHEAIRPTNVDLTPKKVARYLDKEQLAVYTLIWTRTVASQMADATVERTRIEVPVGDYLFVATGSVIKFPGYLKIYEEAKDEAGKTESESEGVEPVLNKDDEQLPRVDPGDVLKVGDLAGKQHFTQPPPRFTEAGLIKELEKQGIGRPSTYAAIISTIQDREYAEKEGGSFRPTELGSIVTELLTESFPQVLDVKFTAKMEGQLDDVEEGKADWVELLNGFYQPFVKRLETAQEQMRNLKAEQQPTEHVCEKCGSTMVVRWGRNGKFLACSGYPNCRNTKPIRVLEDGTVEIVKDEVTDEKCPNCGRAMVIKSGRRGRFMACSGYPECKTSKPLPIGVKCPRPGCTGELVERQSGRGRTFYSCNAYPECRYLIGERPEKKRCEVCGEDKFTAGKGVKQKVFGCSRGDCPYEPAWGPKEEETQNAPRRAPKKAAKKAGDDEEKKPAKKAAKKKAAPKKKAVKKKAAKKKSTKKAAKKKSPARKTVAAKAKDAPSDENDS